MTITNNAQFGNFVSITPLKVKYSDATEASMLFVKSNNDDLYQSANFTYTLRDANFKIMGAGAVEMSGSDYANWTGDNVTPFTFVAGKINVTIAS